MLCRHNKIAFPFHNFLSAFMYCQQYVKFLMLPTTLVMHCKTLLLFLIQHYIISITQIVL